MVILLRALKSAGFSCAGLLVDFVLAADLLLGEPSNLFRSSLSAVKLNLIFCFLNPDTSMSPLSLVSAKSRLNLLLASSFLMSACAAKLNVPFTPPLGKVGSLISKLPASLGISNIKFSILPVKGDENLPVTVRLPCTIAKSPVMPLLCKALGEPFMSASTILAFSVSPDLSCAILKVTFLLETSSF